MDLDISRLHVQCMCNVEIENPDMYMQSYMIKFLFDSPNISILAGSIFTNLAGVLKEIKPFETFLSDQMAKHVGLIPSLDGGLYQVNGDKVEVS